VGRGSAASRLAIHGRLGYEEFMKETYTAVIKQSGDWWIGWIEEVPGVNCQEARREQLLDSLRVTLREALEFNRREALDAAGEGFDEESIAL
jgi:hypothetical protein